MNGLIELTPDHLKAIKDKGFCYVETRPGNFIRVTIKDIRITKEDMERIKSGEFDE